MRFAITILICIPWITSAQSNIKSKIDSLKFVSEIPYECEIIQNGDNSFKNDTFIYSIGCGDRLFWDVVKLKVSAIPYLLEQLDNLEETPTSFPYQGGQCKVADIAYVILEEIVHGLPTAKLLNVNPNNFDCGYCYYYLTLREKENRIKFKKAVSDWYAENKENLFWVSNNKYMTCDCSGKHPSGGHYEIKK